MTGPRVDLADLYTQYRASQRAPTAPPAPAAPAPDLAALHAEYLAQKAPESTGDRVAGFTRALVGQGLAAGFGDEIEGGVRALGAAAQGAPFVPAYQHARDQVRTAQHAFEQRHPVAATGAELVGGLAGALLPVGEAARVLGTGAKIGRAAMIGAGYGALAGLGKGEGDLASQAASTAGGAALGAVLGGGLQAGGSAVGAARRVLSETPGTRALRQVATDVARSGQVQAPAPGMTLADALGVPGQRRLDYALSVPSTGGTEGAEYLAARAGGRAQRLQQGAEQALGTARGNVAADEAARAASRGAAARANYGAAAQESVPVGLFERLANIDGPNPFARAYEHGRVSASVDGVRLPAWAQIEEALTTPTPTANTLRTVPVQALDYMKRGVDKLVQRGTDAAFAIDRTDARNMGTTLRAVLAEADQHAPAYARARRAFADAMELEDAAGAGGTALRGLPEQVAQDLPQFSPPAQQVYRQHMAQDLWQRVTGKDTRGTRSLATLAAPTTQDALRAAAPTPAHADALRALVGNERTMQETETTALRNSATARRLLMARDAEGANASDALEPAKAGLSLLMGNIGPAVQLATRRGYARYAQGVNEQTADALAQLLLAGRNGPHEIGDVLNTIAQFNAQRGASPLPARALAGRVGGHAAGLLLGPGDR